MVDQQISLPIFQIHREKSGPAVDVITPIVRHFVYLHKQKIKRSVQKIKSNWVGK